MKPLERDLYAYCKTCRLITWQPMGWCYVCARARREMKGD